ncbi:gamma-glutamyltranspeptidase [Gymnopilus junonius]|uniref:Glutathione hydrolase n=1 Tax=Gymnopilus junonius TaxID=109634 RepID=A0A9P5TQF6_GYMJU|nr:gamma-glutamyltranspeptidase [Gymnopilus junonius]
MGIPKLERLDDDYDLLPINRSFVQHPKPAFSRLRKITLLTLAGLALFTFYGYHHCLYSPRNIPPHKHRNPAYLIHARNGAVASENKRCSDIGVNALKEGGNAVDAAVATTFCIGVVNMFSSGIGGGGFMTIRIPSRGLKNTNSEVYTIDFRERAPSLANTTMYISDPRASRFGGLAVGVPGEVRGLEEAHRRWGSLPWKRLIEPSITLARGWEVDKELGRRIPWFAGLFLTNPDWTSIFAPNGRLLREGEIIRRTNLSITLTKIAEEGAKAFYTGSIADSIVRKVRLEGGILSHEDLKNYTVKVERALEGTYRNKKIYTTHAPTSGPVLLHMLNLIEKYDMKEMNSLNVHRLLEVMKFGFAARTRVSDPNFTNLTERIDEIPLKLFADKIFPNITDDQTHPPEYYNPTFDVETDHGTSHTSIVDKNGLAVALTSTVNLVFGSQVLDPVTGIIFNDEMDDFSTPGTPNAFGLWPSPFNYPEPGKRPLSSTAPTIIENADGSFHLAIGGSGGSRIFPSIFQVLLNLDWGMDISQAIEFGRLHDQLYPLVVDADDVYPPEILQDLQNLGHNVTIYDINRVAAVIQAVQSDKNVIYAASDSRKNGIAAGY